MITPLFPYFGGKRAIAHQVWARLGTVANYIEPFCGSCALLLSNPQPAAIETVNDLNGHLANFWRAVQADPESVARYADWPVSELDLHARGDWLFYGQAADEFQERMRADPDWYDAKVAGWWLWGQCCWIGGGWGARDAGMGIHRKLPHLGDAGRGIHRQLPHLGDAGRGEFILQSIAEVSRRLRDVRVCCGDWWRVLTPSVTFGHGLTGICLDPPYGHSERDNHVYATEMECPAEVREWCERHGEHPLLRIALCGYAGEHDSLEDRGWIAVPWKTHGGYANQGNGRAKINKFRETVWFSPHCLRPDLFDDVIFSTEGGAHG